MGAFYILQLNSCDTRIKSNMIESIRFESFPEPAIHLTSFIPRLVALTKRIASHG